MRRRVATGLTVLLLVLVSSGTAQSALAADSGDGVGVVDPTTGVWYLRDPITGETTSFFYGLPGDLAFVGDWDCDGVDTPGLYRQSEGYVYLRNSNHQGVADARFYLGNPGDVPIAGDFDGDGCDTVSVYRPGEGRVFILNRLGSEGAGLGQADHDYHFGVPGDRPFAGDFDHDGIDEVGLHRVSSGHVYLRLTHTQGPADLSFLYGHPGDVVLAGDWPDRGGEGADTIGVFRPASGTFYLSHSNNQGLADIEFVYGNQSLHPVAGSFGDLPGGDPPPCGPGPFAGSVPAILNAQYPGKLITAHVHDLRTGCAYGLNSANRQLTASVFKVLVLAGTLHEAQRQNRAVTDWEMSQLTPMISRSANPEVRRLWSSFGGSPWFREQAGTFGLTETHVVGDDGQPWGRTTTSALDQVNLLRQVLLGEWGPLEAQYRQVALDLMTSVVPEQTWGITAGVPQEWVVAQKNGFAGPTINSVGWVDEPGPSQGYVVAILSWGWGDHPSGIAAVEHVSEVIAASLITP